jgi:DNA adenine methylase
MALSSLASSQGDGGGMGHDPGMTGSLPRQGVRAVVPPVKCQGIKSKLVPFILGSIRWPGDGCWIEPFVGSGVVAFTLAPERARLADTNPHIIGLYQAIQRGEIDPPRVRSFLQAEGSRLRTRGESHYYAVRERFNACGDPLDFLFLNRSCFNGLMRFNRQGGFNVPFNRKPERFAPAYVTKIVNQVDRVARVVAGRDWTFAVADWTVTLRHATRGDFVYADPPYVARFSDYYDTWAEHGTYRLLAQLVDGPADFALSTWSHNRHRRNDFLRDVPDACAVVTTRHYYHLGATENLRNEVEEALITRRSAGGDGATTARPAP